MKITDYMPEIYENNLEMNSLLESQGKEFERNVKPSIQNAFKDNFLLTATEDGVEKYEKIFSIIPDKTTEDLEVRKQVVMNRLLSQIPFTERFLQNQLDALIGEGQWTYDFDYANYTIDISITTPGRTWLNELRALLDRVMPCNILWTINVYAISWQGIKENLSSWQDVLSKGTWQDVMDAEWL